MALRNADAADPVGRAWGWPLPGEGRPCGRLTPWRCRHCRKLALLPELEEPDDDAGAGAALLALHPAARVPASRSGPSTGSQARRRAGCGYGLVNMSPSWWAVGAP
ncbi:MAG: hypothetical protein QOG05_3128 [Streptosporangiaceae bacterium]|jgi:hypothetical protein|nr:hypothetical protein [Streptosporangiaceae bacterium]